jgi:hypothetical protein
MTQSKQKAVELVKKFTTLDDAILCVEEIIHMLKECEEDKDVNPNLPIGFWQEVLTHLNEML